MVAAPWLIVALLLAAITSECLFGQVKHELVPAQMRGDVIALVILPAPPFPWQSELGVDVFENGRRLGPRLEGPRSVSETGGGAYADPVRDGSGLQRFTALYFTASDGSEPARNGRSYAVRYPRWALPATFAFLLGCWVVLPLTTVHLVRCLAGPRPRAVGSLGVAGWSVLVSALVYSLFALQAWLPPSNAPWLIAVAVAGVAPFLARLPVPRASVPGWCLWCAGLLVWVLLTSLGGTSYASPGMAAGFLAVAAGGALLYFGTRGSLEGSARAGRSPIVAVFLVVALASLARDAGFDIAGTLATLGLSPLRTEGIENLWTAKFLGHWLLVTLWCTLAAFGLKGVSRHRDTALVASLGFVALWLNGTKSGLVALVISTAVAGGAMLRPRATRRLVVVVLVLAALTAPLWAGLPWRAQARLPSHLTEGPLSGLEMDVRGGVWEFSRRLISLHPLEGWGFGASASLPGRQLPIADALGVEPSRPDHVLARHPVLAGGHPHNAALLTWLDLGLIGAVLLAGLLAAVGHSIARVERQRYAHAALLGLLTVTATFLAFNYPVWEPEIASMLWMTAVLAASHLPQPVFRRPELVRHGIVVLVVIAIGCALLVEERASRWLTARDQGAREILLSPDGDSLAIGGAVHRLEDDRRIDAGARLVAPQGRPFIHGWAYGPPGSGDPDVVLVFVGTELVGTVWPEWPTLEVFRRSSTRDVRALLSGFLVPVVPADLDIEAPLTVVMIRGQDVAAARLPPLSATLPGHSPPAESPAGDSPGDEPSGNGHAAEVVEQAATGDLP